VFATRLSREDFLDNCEWCVKQARNTQPLDLNEWHVRCKQVPKPVWFTHKQLGRCHGVGKQLTQNNWLFSETYGWVYIVQSHPSHFYIHRASSWYYIKQGKVYDHAQHKWLHH
jgi:hypothetical protein